MQKTKNPQIALAAGISLALAILVGVVDARLMSTNLRVNSPTPTAPTGVAGPLAPLARTLA